jgi:hypothetical protein
VRDDPPASPRRRRRAVGPAGARPADPGEVGRLLREPDDEPAPVEDDDERLRREVPPHHGG